MMEAMDSTISQDALRPGFKKRLTETMPRLGSRTKKRIA
jgi:hypothetical protein